MEKIKTYEEFVNEEINLRKGLMGAALGAGLSLSNPSFSQNTLKDSTLQSRVDDVKYKMDKIGNISNIDCWYKNIDGKWSNLKSNGLEQIEKTYTRLENISSYTFKYDSSEYIVFLINSTHPEDNPKVGDRGDILIFKSDDILNIENVKYNDTNIIKAIYTPLLLDINFESSIIKALSYNYEWNKEFKKDNKEGGILYKLGYQDGIKKIRFKFDISDSPYSEVENLEIENSYYEMNLDLFKTLIKKVETVPDIVDEYSVPIGEEIYDVVEEDPSFIGGYSKLNEYIEKNMKYPPSAVDLGIKGRVIVKFVVEKDGSISNTQIESGIVECIECNKEAIRLIKNSPKWNPGKNDGKPVRTFVRIPIKFDL